MRDHPCIHDIPKPTVGHRSKYGHFPPLDHEQTSPREPYQGLARPYPDDGDDRWLTCAHTKHFDPFCSSLKVLVPRVFVLGVFKPYYGWAKAWGDLQMPSMAQKWLN